MRLTYKRLTEDDWKLASSIEQEVSDGKLFKAYTEESEAREYLRKSTVYAVQLDEKPIGTISYELKDKDHAYIDSMTIIPDYQGKGYASQALDFIFNQIKDIKTVDLVTHPHNVKALQIYFKHGFIIDGWIDNYFGDGEPRVKLVYLKS